MQNKTVVDNGDHLKNVYRSSRPRFRPRPRPRSKGVVCGPHICVVQRAIKGVMFLRPDGRISLACL